ncbi:hypothetical protein MILUP08_42804 [Micromonospora lupini str. Lupac 08]|uniref:Uncharacterized protein n=1 Tax=Micromonospora lupini str. Lupac 08 TaxID=1150864 RepID=I0L226_9ACTN|nr:hypothetical protein MILUP08_42804 [Micromonospora lupini str. Lupac 08]
MSQVVGLPCLCWCSPGYRVEKRKVPASDDAFLSRLERNVRGEVTGVALAVSIHRLFDPADTNARRRACAVSSARALPWRTARSRPAERYGDRDACKR